jgi:hypothetical protein
MIMPPSIPKIINGRHKAASRRTGFFRTLSENRASLFAAGAEIKAFEHLITPAHVL